MRVWDSAIMRPKLRCVVPLYLKEAFKGKKYIDAISEGQCLCSRYEARGAVDLTP